MSLLDLRLAAARARRRPPECVGCPLDPSTPGYDPLTGGGFVPPAGERSAPLLVVGIAPAEVEEQRGIPLCGPSGKKLDSALTWALDGRRLEVRKLNAVNCRTSKVGLAGEVINRDPTAHELRECGKRFLLPELASTTARVILVLGQLVFDHLLKPRGVALHRLPRVGHRFTFALTMGHRTKLPQTLFQEDQQ